MSTNEKQSPANRGVSKKSLPFPILPLLMVALLMALTSVFGQPDPVYVFTNFVGFPSTAGNQDGTGSGARFNWPAGVAVNTNGTLYVADSANHTIRQVTPDGVVTTLAGSAGSPGTNDGTGSAARFNNPVSVAVDGSNHLYVADSASHTIRKITPAGVVATLAGVAGVSGTNDGSSAVALFNIPSGVAVDAAGNVCVADYASHTIRKVTFDGVVTTLAGSPGVMGSSDGTNSAALFKNPSGVAVDNAGNVYVVDSENYTIRKVTPAGLVTTLAGKAGFYGTDDGAGGNARFYAPHGVAADNDGTVFVVDKLNMVRKVTSAGTVTTLTQNLTLLASPRGIAVDQGKNLYVADYANNRIAKGALSYSPLSPRISMANDKTNLYLVWPGWSLGRELQVATNLVKVGFSTNWFAVPGSTSSTQVTLPMTNPAAYYRLYSP